MATKLKGAIPYKGDDWAQSMAKTMAEPMVAMGLMAVAVGFVLGIAGGLNFGDFFSPTGSPDDLGRAEALVHLAPATIFLGMGFILGGITMLLVKIIRKLRDAGKDVQESLGAEAYQLKKPWMGLLTPPVMMMGVMIEIAAFILGIVAAVAIGGVDASALAENTLAGEDLADVGTARAWAAWLPGLRLFGVATILISIVFTLLTIQKIIRFQGDRITELAGGRVRQEALA